MMTDSSPSSESPLPSSTQRNPLLRSMAQWMEDRFSNPGAISLFFFLLFGFLFIEFFGSFFLPVLISVVLTYLLNTLVRRLSNWRCPRLLAVMIVYLAFLGVFLYCALGLLPSLWKQLASLVEELPNAFTRSQSWVVDLMHHYPAIFSDNVMQHVSDFFKQQAGHLGQTVLRFSLATLSNVIQVVLYLVLVPLLVFFFLKDAPTILAWFGRFMPKDKSLVVTVWSEVNEKIGCYVRGRVTEIIIVGLVSAVTFKILGLHYAVLLGSLVGVSVIIPYIGAIVVTVPVLIIALMEWGLAPHFLYLLIAYVVIIILDANVLVPLLFSETMDLHPVVIILSVLIFGGLWGFWGVFFAIPLATLCHAVLRAWPSSNS